MACYPNVWSVPIDILNHVCKYAEEIQAEHACVCLFLLEVAFVAGFVFSSFFQLVISRENVSSLIMKLFPIKRVQLGCLCSYFTVSW